MSKIPSLPSETAEVLSEERKKHLSTLLRVRHRGSAEHISRSVDGHLVRTVKRHRWSVESGEPLLDHRGILIDP